MKEIYLEEMVHNSWLLNMQDCKYFKGVKDRRELRGIQYVLSVTATINCHQGKRVTINKLPIHMDRNVKYGNLRDRGMTVFNCNSLHNDIEGMLL